jgi:hypothetical protein
MSVTFVGVMGICCVAPRVGSAAEGVHIAVASPVALAAALTIHVVARDSVATEKAGGRVRDVGRNGKAAL